MESIFQIKLPRKNDELLKPEIKSKENYSIETCIR